MKRSYDQISPEGELRRLIDKMISSCYPYLPCKDFYHFMTDQLCCNQRYGCECRPIFEERFNKKMIMAKNIFAEMEINLPSRNMDGAVAYAPNLDLMTFLLDGYNRLFEKFMIDITDKDVFNNYLTAKMVNLGGDALERIAQRGLETNCISLFQSLFNINYNFADDQVMRYTIKSLSFGNSIWVFFINRLQSFDANEFTEDFWMHVSNNKIACRVLRSTMTNRTIDQETTENENRPEGENESPEPRRLSSESLKSESYAEH